LSGFFIPYIFPDFNFLFTFAPHKQINRKRMKTEQILNYEAPLVEVIEVEVEKGFATSAGTNPIENEVWD
jgi:hypothetical protein